ncbi:MAG: ABC transporter substrate-binding protein [Oscillospiraceae bacterium]|jgi:raffinose/stachyose/melibiose transport system substrate-binding protein|nr:ABC transporter substrate-binding protein [Oscillospiraceae bacterium]
MPSYVLRVISLFVTMIYTSLSLYACNVETGGAESVLPADAYPIGLTGEVEIISILQSRGEIGQNLQQAADLYEPSSANIRLSIQTVANPSDYRIALRSRILSGERVDIFHLFGHQDLLDMQGYTQNISDMSWVWDAVPGTLDAMSLGASSLYGVPYALDGAGLIVNRAIFEKANIYLGNIITLEALEEIFIELQEKINEGELAEDFPNLEAVTEFSAQDKAWLGDTISNMLLAGAFETPNEAALANYVDMPQMEHAEEFIRIMALYSSCTKWEQLNETTQYKQLENGMATQRIAVIFQNVSAYTRITAANPEIKDDLRLLPVPIVQNDVPESAVFAGAPAYWAVNSTSSTETQTEAKRFLTWLYCSDEGAAALAGQLGVLSPYRETARDTGVPLHNQLLGYIDAGKMRPQLQNEFPLEWGGNTVADGIQNYLTHDITWADLEQSCREAWHSGRSALID